MSRKPRGFGSPNFDKELARKIQSMGGKKSKGGGRKKKIVTDEENHDPKNPVS